MKNYEKKIGQHIDRDGMGVFDDELEWLNESSSSMLSIVEIGSFKGRSTYALLESCRGCVYSVDNNYDKGKEVLHKNLEQFSNITYYEMNSEEASKKFKDRSIDMVFIDGDHKYESVKKDIEIWLPKVKRIICGHDYIIEHPGVIRAVSEMFSNKISIFHTIWYKTLE